MQFLIEFIPSGKFQCALSKNCLLPFSHGYDATKLTTNNVHTVSKERLSRTSSGKIAIRESIMRRPLMFFRLINSSHYDTISKKGFLALHVDAWMLSKVFVYALSAKHYLNFCNSAKRAHSLLPFFARMEINSCKLQSR